MHPLAGPCSSGRSQVRLTVPLPTGPRHVYSWWCEMAVGPAVPGWPGRRDSHYRCSYWRRPSAAEIYQAVELTRLGEVAWVPRNTVWRETKTRARRDDDECDQRL